jgi:hypothetical protein
MYFVSYNDVFKNMNTKHILKVNDKEKLQVLRIIELQLHTQIQLKITLKTFVNP